MKVCSLFICPINWILIIFSKCEKTQAELGLKVKILALTNHTNNTIISLIYQHIITIYFIPLLISSMFR